MCGVEEPLLPEPGAVEGGATQSEGAIETQEARYPWLHKTARLRSLDVWVEISSWTDQYRASRAIAFGHDVLGRRTAGVIPPPNMVYLRHQTPTTSIPLNPLGARGWQVVPALVERRGKEVKQALQEAEGDHGKEQP